MENERSPVEWTDDEKMAVLFAPFRESRGVNPNSWDRKLQFWSHFILQKYQLMGKAAFNGIELPSQFERKGKVPFCLGVVVQDMIKKGQLQKLSDFQVGADKSWASWSFSVFVKKPVSLTFDWFVKKPLSWTYRKLISGDTQSAGHNTGVGESTLKLENADYVLIDVIKDLSDKIVTHHQTTAGSPADCVRSLERLRAEFRAMCGDTRSFDLALMWLCKHRRCVVQDTEHGKVVVFASQNQPIVKELSQDELRVYSLKNAEEKLNHEIAVLGDEMEKTRQEAKMYLQKGMKTSAKNCLRKKKRLEAQQDKKEVALDNIHQLLFSIQQAHSDKQVLDAYSSGVQAFKSFNQEHGMSAEAVDDVMIGVQEVLEDQDEMNRSISSPLLPADMTSDDLEAELEGILGDPEMTNQELPTVPEGPVVRPMPHQEVIDSMCRMRLADEDLPDVPAHNPDSPVGFTLPSPPRQQPQANVQTKVPLLSQAERVSPVRTWNYPTGQRISSPSKENSPPQERIPIGNRQTWGSPIAGDEFANFSMDGASNYSPTMQDSGMSYGQNSPSNMSWGNPAIPSESPMGNTPQEKGKSPGEGRRQGNWLMN